MKSPFLIDNRSHSQSWSQRHVWKLYFGLMSLVLASWMGCEANSKSPQPSADQPAVASAEPDRQPIVKLESPAAGEPRPAIELNSLPKATSTEKVPKAKRDPIYIEEPNGEQLIADALVRAKREHKHVLIEWGGNWCGWCYKLHDVFHQDKTVRPIVFEEYELVLIDERKNYDLMLAYGGKDRKYSFPHLTILDADGNVLTNQETGSLEEGPNHKPELVVAFLSKWIPARLNATSLLNQALASAKQEEKAVMLRVGDPYCGWCRVLSQFIDDQKDTFNKDYVSLKIDTLRMDQGKEIAEKFKPEKCDGVPWFVFLNPNGETIATSVSSQGNIGFPSEPHEIAHFGSVLRKTKSRLAENEIESLLSDLHDRREKRKQKQ